MFNNNTAANPDGLVQYNWLPLLKLWAPPPLPLFTNPLYPSCCIYYPPPSQHLGAIRNKKNKLRTSVSAFFIKNSF